MRVLILADSCNPQWPSLPLVGYNAAKAIADHAEVVVATQVRNRPNIESAGLGRAEAHYIDTEYIARPLYQVATMLRRGDSGGWSTAQAMAVPAQYAFEWEVWKAFRKRLEAGEFDVVHRLTPMSPAMPSPIVRWSPVPTIIGPLNGGLKWPREFKDELHREREWLSKFRRAYRVLPYHRTTYQRAAAILASFEHTIDDIAMHDLAPVINFPEVGFDPTVFDCGGRSRDRDERVVLFVGRLVPCKMTEVLIRAFGERKPLHRHRLVFVGEGPERARIESIAREYGVADRVEITGWKCQAEVGQLMRDADIFAFPSIRELGAGVVVEAMASRLACVVVDYGGPGGLIDETRGVKIPLGTREALVNSFGDALVELVEDPPRLGALGEAARAHALSHYSWQAKARKTRQVYEWVLGRGTKPCFWDEKPAHARTNRRQHTVETAAAA